MQITDLTLDILLFFGGIQTVLTALVGFLAKMWLTRAFQRQKEDHEKKMKSMEASLEQFIYMYKVQSVLFGRRLP